MALHNPFEANVKHLIFHYDFLDFLNKSFDYYGVTEEGCFRMNNQVFRIVTEPAKVMTKVSDPIPNELTGNKITSKLVWKITNSVVGLCICDAKTEKDYLTINFSGIIKVGEAIPKVVERQEHITIWDFFSEREF